MSDAAQKIDPEATSETSEEVSAETSTETSAESTAEAIPEAAESAEAPADTTPKAGGEEAGEAPPAIEPSVEPKPEPTVKAPAAFGKPKLVMLVEPDSPVRGSVLAMSRTLAHVDMKPFSSVELGEEFMKDFRIQALLLSVGEGAEPMDFLARLRRGECPCDADIPVVVMAPTCDAQLAGQLKEYGISRLLIEPFKLGDIAHTLEQLWEIKVNIPPQKPAPDPVVEDAEKEADDEAKPSEKAAGETPVATDATEASKAAESPDASAEGVGDPQAEPA